jgi:hypothetical protein
MTLRELINTLKVDPQFWGMVLADAKEYWRLCESDCAAAEAFQDRIQLDHTHYAEVLFGRALTPTEDEMVQEEMGVAMITYMRALNIGPNGGY